MDERIEKAFNAANLMITLANQRKVIFEEFQQKLVYYKNGGTFQISPDLIMFVKVTLDFGNDNNVPFIDENNLPIIINDVQAFYDEIVEIYYTSLYDYYNKFSDLKSKRKIKDIFDL